MSGIAAISTDGLLGVELTTGTNSANNFADFVCETLVPNMQPFNGHSERSVVVMDNCSIHHVHFVMEIILPPYSSDYNPTELTFSSVKSYLKNHIRNVMHGYIIAGNLLICHVFIKIVLPKYQVDMYSLDICRVSVHNNITTKANQVS